MALFTVITGAEDIQQNGQVTLTAAVAGVGPFQYAWTASRGVFVGATDQASVVYHANFSDASDVDVTITCNVTRLATTSPVLDDVSLTALADIGITGILVNMFLTDLGAVVANSNNVIYEEGGNGTLEANSDDDLSSTIHIRRIRWNNAANAIVINSSGTGNLGNFFTGNTNQSLFVVFENGTYVEFTGDANHRGATWAGWTVSDANVLAKFNALTTTSDLVVGVADTGSIGVGADSGSATETFTVLSNMPGIQAISSPIDIVVNTAWEISVRITGNPTKVTVEGELHRGDHEWNAPILRIFNTFDTLLALKTFKITAFFADDTTLERVVTYNVISSAPIIPAIDAPTMYKGDEYYFYIPISNFPTEVSADGLWAGVGGAQHLDEATETDGILISGDVGDGPYSVNSAEFLVKAINTAMEVTRTFQHAIEDINYDNFFVSDRGDIDSIVKSTAIGETPSTTPVDYMTDYTISGSALVSMAIRDNTIWALAITLDGAFISVFSKMDTTVRVRWSFQIPRQVLVNFDNTMADVAAIAIHGNYLYILYRVGFSVKTTRVDRIGRILLSEIEENVVLTDTDITFLHNVPVNNWAWDICVDGTFIYYIDVAGSATFLRRYNHVTNTLDSNRMNLDSNHGNAFQGIAVDDDYIYYSTDDGNRIIIYQKSGLTFSSSNQGVPNSAILRVLNSQGNEVIAATSG